MKDIMRKLICSVMSITVLTASLPSVTVQADETEAFPYTLYSRRGATISASQLCVNGNLHANDGVSFNANHMNLNGSVTSESETNREIAPVYADHSIIETYFPDQSTYNSGTYSCADTNVFVNQALFSYDGIILSGNTNLNAGIGTYDNIEITGNCFNSNQAVLYSRFGDVTITADNSLNLNGLIYAPFGTVTLSAQNVSVNGIILAENVVIQSGNINLNNNNYFAHFVGNTSENYDFSDIPEKYKGDSDGDELPDIYEKVIGTDPLNSDTDSDGLPDGYELMKLGTDPLLVDTDENEVSDADEDFDEDGLNNLGEYQHETDPYDTDSDTDGYTDGDEIGIYLTDPANPDTDNDGLLDGDEGTDGYIYTTYQILFDPLLPDTDGNGVLDGAEPFAQSFTYFEEDESCAVREVSIDMVTAGVLKNNTTVTNILNKDVMCSDVVGLVGAPYDIKTLDVTESATLRFRMDPDKMGDTQLSDLMFLWYNEDDDEFVELETAIDETTNTVSTVVPHFSKYMVVDKIKWFEAWQRELNYTTNNYDRPICHTVLAIDCSSSMNTNDPGSSSTTYRYLATCNFINSMDENDKAALVKYNGSASVICHLTNNKNDLKTKAALINSSGGTSFDAALLTSVAELKNNMVSPSTRNYIILLSDGESSVSASTWNEINTCSNLIIHTVCLRAKQATTPAELQRQKNAEDMLADIARRGHGEPYIAKTAEDLNKIYTQVGLGISVDPTDNDCDGLPDILETVGIRCSNGRIITSDPTKWDTDGDGLKDGDEILKESLRIRSYNYPAATYQLSNSPVFFTMKSDPNKADTDEDGLNDMSEIVNSYSDARLEDSDGDGVNDFNDALPMIPNQLIEVNWNTWNAIDIATYMSKRHISEMVFYGVHEVMFGRYHTQVIAFVNSNSPFYSDAHFSNNAADYSDNWNGIKYATFGAGPDHGISGDPLKAGYSRPADIKLNIKVQLTNVTPTSNCADKINCLISAQDYFMDHHPNNPAYVLLSGFDYENHHNSNSYAAGLLQYAALDDFGGPQYLVPGYTYPVARHWFGG